MPIESGTWYSATCDKCKYEYESDVGVIALFKTEAELKSALDGWKIEEDSVICEDCAYIDEKAGAD